MTLAEYPYVIVRLGCSLCARKGQYRLARLAAKYGCEIEMDALLAYLAGDCAMWGRQRHPYHKPCGALFLDLGRGPPPDVPPVMRHKLKLVA